MTWKRWVQHVDYFFHFYGLRIRKLKGGILRIEHRYISIEKYPMFGLACMFLLVDLVYLWNFIKNPQISSFFKEFAILFGLLIWVYLQFLAFSAKILTLGSHYLVLRLTLAPGLTSKTPIATIQKLKVSKRDYRTRYFSGWIYYISALTNKDDVHLLTIEDDFERVETVVTVLQEHLGVPVEYPEEKSKKRIKP